MTYPLPVSGGATPQALAFHLLSLGSGVAPAAQTQAISETLARCPWKGVTMVQTLRGIRVHDFTPPWGRLPPPGDFLQGGGYPEGAA